jgi:subtilase family serine protease
VVEDSDLYSATDVTTFRNTFGLNAYSGSFSTTHPAPLKGITNCNDPGVLSGNDFEAAVDADWVSAAAPGSTIQIATCKDTTTFGGLLALENIVSLAKPPSIISMSYGECEAENGAVSNAAFSLAYQTAALAGISVFVSTGDEGAASCDANASYATHGIGVSGFASTPYNVAVGGTDFGDYYAGTTSGYWNSTNSTTYTSAKGYVSEIPWNDSCAGVLLATYEGYAAAYGTSGFCNATKAANFITTASGSGGPSNCATGTPSTAGVANGSCKGYAKPSWQSGLFGNPSDAVRDLPDVSLFAGNGLWGHYYVVCYSHTAVKGGAVCTAGNPSVWSGGGGTSFSAPILAAMQALVNQRTGSNQGNPNPTYYAIAKTEYGATGSLGCNSSTQPLPRRGFASACVFYDVTLGDIDVNCRKLGGASENCYLPSSTYGVLSKSTSAYQIAYGTNTGWDFATGIGTVNAYNLVFSPNWTQAP